MNSEQTLDQRRADMAQRTAQLRREARSITVGDVIRHRRAASEARKLGVEAGVEADSDGVLNRQLSAEGGPKAKTDVLNLVGGLLVEPLGQHQLDEQVASDLAQAVVSLAREQFGIELVIRHVSLHAGNVAQAGPARP